MTTKQPKTKSRDWEKELRKTFLSKSYPKWYGMDVRNFTDKELIDFIKEVETQTKQEARREVVEEGIALVKHTRLMAKTAYQSGSWDSGVHDTCEKLEKSLVKLLRTSPSKESLNNKG